MKIKGYILGISVAMASLLVSSCDTDNLTDVYQSSTIGATFITASQSVSFPSSGYEGFDVEVVRAQTEAPATIKVTSAVLLDADGNALPLPSTIQVPSEVNFEAGEGRSSLHVFVGDITPGETYQLAITLDETVAPVDATMTKIISIFRDYTYTSLGTGTLNSTFFEATGTAEIQKADQTTWYKAIGLYEEGYDIIFKVAQDGKTVTVDQQAAASDISGYGTLHVAGSGTLENGVITVELEFTVSAGSFGSCTEELILPAAN